MSSQTTSKIFMVKPACFKYNEQTGEDNAFQQKGFEEGAQEKAMKESEEFIKLLKDNDIEVIAVQDTKEPETPDSVFPNNWFTTHEGGILVLYPMCAPNRRDERKEIFLEAIKKSIDCKKIIDLTKWENEQKYLEGTGSMVLDRVNKIAYACKSPRTSEAVLDDFCAKLGYKPILFNAVDKDGKMIYHTNVLMCVGSSFAIICKDTIKDQEERNKILDSFNQTGKKVVEISLEQMQNYAGNMLEIKNKKGKRFLIMSQTAYNSLNHEQKHYLEEQCTILHPKIECIEINGGGSARCMMAELY